MVIHSSALKYLRQQCLNLYISTLTIFHTQTDNHWTLIKPRHPTNPAQPRGPQPGLQQRLGDSPTIPQFSPHHPQIRRPERQRVRLRLPPPPLRRLDIRQWCHKRRGVALLLVPGPARQLHRFGGGRRFSAQLWRHNDGTGDVAGQ